MHGPRNSELTVQLPTAADDFHRLFAGQTVIDLLPNEHRGAWVPDPTRYDLVRPILATPDGKPAGHAGKATKGKLTRALLQSGNAARTLASFDPGELVLTVE